MSRYICFVKYSLAVAAVTLGMSGAAVALPCSIASVTTSTACQVGSGNNDSVSAMNAGLGFFGNTDWLLADKSDGAPSIAGFSLTFDGVNAKLGNWSVTDFAGYTKAVLVVKGGSVAWVAYLLDLTDLAGTWSTADILNSGGNRPDMSHLSLYVADKEANTVAPVPLPAGAPLLLAGLAALAFLRRRSKAA